MIQAESKFYIFGMGHREKLLYKCGSLSRIFSGEVIFSWDVLSEEYIYESYTVVLTLKNGKAVKIHENENGIFVDEELICGGHISLPSFDGHKYWRQLRILHAEILTSFNGTTPVPNIYVYDKAWYRDGAMMALALEKTGNIELLRPWALSVTELYDKNNAGGCEPDNLGQLAFVLSYFVDKSYPLIKEIEAEAKRIFENGLLRGVTDFGCHEIYSTLWLKLAFDRLGIDTSFIKIPEDVIDTYAYMFWMDKKSASVNYEYENPYDKYYPYLWWARAHFRGEAFDKKLIEVKYPMSWESYASQAKYEKIAPLSKEYAKNKYSAPHSWHASEMFLYLIECN